jgi:2-polyprenyl-3-methyl-5-hydroxy-6-metoxy-1,4-benzoquinol methylase
MEWNCCSCRCERLRLVRPYRTHTRYGKDVFGGAKLYTCEACNLVQALPRPESSVVDEYYRSDYRRAAFTGTDVASAEDFPKDNLFYFNRGRSASELIGRYAPFERPEILDIGAGWGHILHALGERYPGANRVAIEYSDVCVKHLERLGIDVITQPVEDVLPRLDRRFDVIVLSHVLEHLLDPMTILRYIVNLLSPRGILYVEVPNIPVESLLRFPDHRWNGRFDEPHITFYSEDTLERLLEAAGLDVRFCDTAGPEYEYISRLRFHMPPLRSTLQSLIPTPLFFGLRRMNVTSKLRVREREPTFYEYGGLRLWLRTVSSRSAAAVAAELP